MSYDDVDDPSVGQLKSALTISTNVIINDDAFICQATTTSDNFGEDFRKQENETAITFGYKNRCRTASISLSRFII